MSVGAAALAERGRTSEAIEVVTAAVGGILEGGELAGHLLNDDLSVEDAVAQTRAEVGPDPFYQSELLSYSQEEE